MRCWGEGGAGGVGGGGGRGVEVSGGFGVNVAASVGVEVLVSVGVGVECGESSVKRGALVCSLAPTFEVQPLTNRTTKTNHIKTRRLLADMALIITTYWRLTTDSPHSGRG